jgi:hypothetical protein
MGMVRDVTQRFVDGFLSPLLTVIQSINVAPDGSKLAEERRILRIGLATLWRYPQRSLTAVVRLLGQRKLWALAVWTARNALADLVHLPLRLVPAAWLARYRALPAPLRRHARFAERKLRMLRWSYLGLSLFYQLELTRAQIPLQRFGKCIEHLVSMLAIVHHAAHGDATMQQVAALQAQLLRDKYGAIRVLSGLAAMQRTRRSVAAVGASLEAGTCSLLDGIEPQAYGHAWEPRAERHVPAAGSESRRG